MKDSKKLIINADDFGLSPKFNKGIIELIEKGIITSTTVMAKREYINVGWLLRYKNLSIGLHLELKEKAEVKNINEQYQRFLRTFGQKPSHVDSHQHMHLNKNNFPKIIKLCQEFNLPLRSVSSDDRTLIKEAGLVTPKKYISWHPKRKEKLFKNLRENKSSTTELVCHPGYFDKETDYPYNKRREDEMEVMTSDEFTEIISNYKKINYHQL